MICPSYNFKLENMAINLVQMSLSAAKKAQKRKSKRRPLTAYFYFLFQFWSWDFRGLQSLQNFRKIGQSASELR